MIVTWMVECNQDGRSQGLCSSTLVPSISFTNQGVVHMWSKAFVSLWGTLIIESLHINHFDKNGNHILEVIISHLCLVPSCYNLVDTIPTTSSMNGFMSKCLFLSKARFGKPKLSFQIFKYHE